MKLLETHLAKNGIDQEYINLLLTIAHKFKAAKNQHLLIPTQVDDRLYYLSSGIIREYKILETETETERTYWFLSGGDWLFSTGSYVRDTPSVCYLQAVEATEGYYFHKYEFEALLKVHAPLSFLGFKMCMEYFLKAEHRDRMLQINNFEDRFAVFEQQQPELIGRISQKMLATYLRVRPERISRLRNERAKKKRM